MWEYKKAIGIDSLIGKTLTSIQNETAEIIFTDTEGKQYKMYHEQDCCESVYVEDIAGDLDDLVGVPILSAYESTSTEMPKREDWDDSFTWTFYHIATIKGAVTIRWYGTSNGYYSERVDFVEL